jgi:adhesin transport system membrane fusion protein
VEAKAVDKKPHPFTPIPERSINEKHHYGADDLAYMKSLSAATLERSTFHSRAVLWVIALSVVWLIAWASRAPIDEIARGEGNVIPSSRVQVVQNLEGGIVEELNVREGDMVKKGQPLLKIQDINFMSSFEENRLRIEELEARSVRLYAQSNDVSFEDAKTTLKVADSHFLKEEYKLFLSNKEQLNAAVNTIQSQLNQRKNELTEVNAKIKRLSQSLSLLNEEITLKRPLVAQGVVPEVELLQLRRELNQAEGDLEASKLSVPRIRSSIQETQSKISEVMLEFSTKAKERYNEVTAEKQLIEQSIGALGDRVNRAIVRAPADGTIKQLFVNTVGGVIKPGMDILEIVPADDILLVEVKIKPSDIAFIRINQPAIVKFTAYDFAIYGGLHGHVSHIGADTVTDEQGNTFYKALIKTDVSQPSTTSSKLVVKVGMIASVDILTGKKTVLDFLLKPILKAKQQALRER